MLLTGAAQGVTPGTQVRVGAAAAGDPEPLRRHGAAERAGSVARRVSTPRRSGHVHLRFRHQAPDRDRRRDAGARRSSASSRCRSSRRTSSPSVSRRSSSVSMPYPGASPDRSSARSIDPIEEAISSISGVDEDRLAVARQLRRRSSPSSTFDKDLQEAPQEIRDKISEIRNELPLEMEEPILKRFDPERLPDRHAGADLERR